MEENTLVDGLYFDKPREGAPDFVKGGLSFNKEQFLKWLEAQPTNDKGYVRADLLLSKKDTLYFKVNDYGIKKENTYNSEVKPEDMPF